MANMPDMVAKVKLEWEDVKTMNEILHSLDYIGIVLLKIHQDLEQTRLDRLEENKTRQKNHESQAKLNDDPRTVVK